MHIFIICLLIFLLWPFMNDFPQADINELLSLDILYQLIKGPFKDHLIQCITNYITKMNTKEANIILVDIHRRHVQLSSLIIPTHFLFCSLNCSSTFLCRSTLFLPGLWLQAVDWWWFKGVDKGIVPILVSCIPNWWFDIVSRIPTYKGYVPYSGSGLQLKSET